MNQVTRPVVEAYHITTLCSALPPGCCLVDDSERPPIRAGDPMASDPSRATELRVRTILQAIATSPAIMTKSTATAATSPRIRASSHRPADACDATVITPTRQENAMTSVRTRKHWRTPDWPMFKRVTCCQWDRCIWNAAKGDGWERSKGNVSVYRNIPEVVPARLKIRS